MVTNENSAHLSVIGKSNNFDLFEFASGEKLTPIREDNKILLSTTFNWEHFIILSTSIFYTDVQRV